MKFYRSQNVFDAALERIRFIFDEFPNVVVCTSGGKDSTATLNLALKIAEEKNRLPLDVVFLDQEAEWQCVIDYIKDLKNDPRINLIWYQVPIRIENATSNIESYLITWEPGKKWMRPYEEGSIREELPTRIFYELFAAVMKKRFPTEKACYLAGVRCEESPARFQGLTSSATYKHITYGKTLSKNLHYTFYPLYDWSYTDVWKAIHDNSWPYCRVYDYMYQYGIQVQQMRVSNLNHETATHALYYLPEIEKDTWEKLCVRLSGINTVSKIKKSDMLSAPKEFPPMFTSWTEYRDYLLDNLITSPETHKVMKDRFEHLDEKYGEMQNLQALYRVQITCILANDSWLTKLENWERKPDVHGWRRWKKGVNHEHNAKNKYITG